MSQTPFKNVRGDKTEAAIVSIPSQEQIAPVASLDDARTNGDTADVGQSHAPELPSTTQPFPQTNPGAGFKIRA